MSLTLGELAVRFGCELRGDPLLQVTRVATLATAEAGALTFLANPQYRYQLADTRATVVVLDTQSAAGCPVAALIHANPYAIYARMAALLYPTPLSVPGISPGASIAPGAIVHPSAQVGPAAIIAEGARIGERSIVGPGCYIGKNASLGADCCLRAHVTLEHGVQLGDRVLIHAGAVIGADGFGFAREGAGWTKVPQVGSVRIGSDVEIGANTTIDRGAIDDTVIGDGVKIDNLVQIAHNCVIGNHTAIAAFVGISGSTHLGQRCMIGGAVGFAGHLEICDDVAVTGKSFVARSIKKPGVYSSGVPVQPAPVWRRLVARLRRLDAMAVRLSALERNSGMAGSADSHEDDNDD
jgi:UDP-3-O-[3-hydroxymyristoyl] glucosamine N-acyltransferase